MVIDNLHLGGSAFSPSEAYPVLSIDADTVLARSVTHEHFKHVSRGYAELGKLLHRIELIEFPYRDLP